MNSARSGSVSIEVAEPQFCHIVSRVRHVDAPNNQELEMTKTHFALFVFALVLGGCATVDNTRDVTKKGDDSTLKEVKKCSGWGCAGADRPTIRVAPDWVHPLYMPPGGGLGTAPRMGYFLPPPVIEYFGPDPKAAGQWIARVDGKWKRCEPTPLHDHSGACFTPLGRASAREWGSGYPPPGMH